MAFFMTSFEEEEFRQFLNACVLEAVKQLLPMLNDSAYPELMTLEQAAKFLGMEPRTLADKARKHLVAYAKPAKCDVFLKEDLVTYVLRYRIPPKDEIVAKASKYRWNNPL